MKTPRVIFLKRLLPAGLLLALLATSVAQSTTVFTGFTLEWTNYALGSGGNARPLVASSTSHLLLAQTTDENNNPLSYSSNLTLAGGNLSGTFDILADKPAAGSTAGLTYNYSLSLVSPYQNGSRSYGGGYQYQYAPAGPQAVDKNSGSSSPVEFVPDHSTTDLCSIRVHVTESCDSPRELKLQGGYGYFDALEDHAAEASSLDPSQAVGFMSVGPASGQYVVTGEFLARPTSWPVVAGTTTIPVNGTLYFTTDNPVAFSATASPTIVAGTGPASGCVADVNVSVTTCGVPEQPVRVTGTVTLNSPQTGCDLVVGGTTLYSGCPVFRSAAQYPYDNTTSIWFDNISDVNDTLATSIKSSGRRLSYVSDAGTSSFDSQVTANAIADFHPGVASTMSANYQADSSATLSAPPADGRSTSLSLDTVQSTTAGWGPAYVADNPSDPASQGTGVLPSGTWVVRADKPNVFNYVADTGVMEGQMHFQGCLSATDLKPSGYQTYISSGGLSGGPSGTPDTTNGKYTIPDYYAPTFKSSAYWFSEVVPGSNPLMGHVESGSSHTQFVSTLDPLLTGYYQVMGQVGPYTDDQLLLQFSKTAPNYVDQYMFATYLHPGSYTLTSNVKVKRDLPPIAFGSVNVRLQAFNNAQPVLFKNAWARGSGVSVIDAVKADALQGFYQANGPTEQLATQQILRLIGPSYTTIRTNNYSGSGIKADLPFGNYADGGIKYVTTDFPDIPGIELPPPSADGGCQSVCTNPSDPTHAVYIDDETAPVVSYPAPPGGHVQAGILTVTATATDSAPIDTVAVNTSFPSAGPATISYPMNPVSSPVTSTLAIPIYVGCSDRADSIVVTDKCGQSAAPILVNYGGGAVDNFDPALASSAASVLAGTQYLQALNGSLTPHFRAAVLDAGPTVDPLTYSLLSITRKDANNAGAAVDVTGALGSTFDASTHTLTWTPDASDFTGAKVPSTVVFTFKVDDICSARNKTTTTGTVTLTVTNNRPPSLAVGTPVSGAEAAVITIPLTGTDPDTGDTISYSCANLPAGMTPSIPFDSAVSSPVAGPTVDNLTWTPPYQASAASPYTIHCWVTDSHGVHDDDGAGACSANGLSGADYTDDGSGKCGKDIVINVAKTYVAPAVTSSGTSDIPEQGTETIAVQATDVNGDPFTLSVDPSTPLPAGATFDCSAAPPVVRPRGGAKKSSRPLRTIMVGGCSAGQASGTFSWTPDYTTAGTYTFVFDATKPDGAGGTLTGTTSVTFNVSNVDRPPHVNPIPDQVTTELTPLAYHVSGADPDIPITQKDGGGDNLTYVQTGLPAGAVFSTTPNQLTNGDAGVVDWTPALGQYGDHLGTYTVTDNHGLADAGTVSIHVRYLNQAPVLTPDPAETGTETQLIQFTTGVTDPRGNPDSCTMSGVPEGAAYNASTKTFQWTPPSGAHLSSPYLLSTTCCTKPPSNAIDPNPPTACSTIGTTLTITKHNVAPVLAALPDYELPEETAVSFTVSATDINGDSIQYSSPDLPPGATLDPETGEFNWTPDYTDASVWVVTLVATDNDPTLPLSSSIQTKITVTNVNRAPVVDAIPDMTVHETQTVSFVVTGFDPDNPITQRNPDLGDALTWSAIGLPFGSEFDPVTGTFSWTTGYSDSGDHAIIFTLTDDKGASDSRVGLIHVLDTNRAPQIAPLPVQNGVENQLLSFAFTITDPDGDPTACTMSGLPAGATFDTATQRFSWTPPFDQLASGVSVFHVGVQCCDSGNRPGFVPMCGNLATEIDVLEVNRAPTLDAVADVTVKTLAPVIITVQGHDPDHESTLTYAAGNLPAGAAFDPLSRTLTWTPTALQDGDFTVHFSVSDGQYSAYQDGLIHVLTPNYDRLGGGLATSGCSSAGGGIWAAALGAFVLLRRRRAKAGGVVP